MAMQEKSRNDVRDKEVEERERRGRQAGMNPGRRGRDKTSPIYELRDATACQHLGESQKEEEGKKTHAVGFIAGWLAKRDE